MDTQIQRYLIDLHTKNNTLRKQAFDALMKLTEIKVDWAGEAFDVLALKLDSSNSFQRSIGMMLLSNLTKSGIESKLAKIIERYLSRLDDEKFITARQSIQACYKAAVYCDSISKQVVDRFQFVFRQQASYYPCKPDSKRHSNKSLQNI